MVSLVAVGLLLLFLLLGFPIYLSLGFLALLLFVHEGTPLISLPQLLVDHLNSETLLAVPLFVIAATFMQRGGVAGALIDCAQAWVGRSRGGLALVCVVACTIFAAICGSSVATAVAIGSVLIPAMTDRKYEPHFALGTTAAAGTLGILIPPSLAMIVYAVIAEESVPRLFLAGVIPGLMQAALFLIWIMVYARWKNYPVEPPIGRQKFVADNVRALPALLIPVIILGGIYSGLMTVTEAAGVAALVAIIEGVFVYRGVKMKEVAGVLAESIKLTATIVFIIVGALAFGHWITSAGIAEALVKFVKGMELKAWQFLLFINVLMLFLGMFLEVFAIILIVMPLILPILKALDINLVHFGIVLTINMEIALISPPVGLNLFVLASVSKQPISTVIRGVMPFLLIMLALLALVTYVPIISTWLPDLVYGKPK
ncbi:MAG TPA: TRAP transporter large permease [Hyphomicrobiaceae bacterium]|nr:TRAP transporter large permease [Hyphomicrobiaceae bacterium]